MAVVVVATAAALGACSADDGRRGRMGAGGATTDTGGTGGGGSPGAGGSGGSPSGGSGGATGGRGGSGGSSTAGADGSVTPADAGRSSDGPTMSPDTAALTDGAIPPAGACDYNPRANVGQIKLKLERIDIPGLPIGDLGKNNTGPSVRDGATLFKFLPGKSDELFFVQKAGRVTHLRISGRTATVLKTLQVPNVSPYADCGLIGMAFDPEFEKNKLVYFGHCTAQYQSKIARFTYDGNTLSDPVDIMRWNGQGGSNVWHAIGSMGFDPRGNLWVLHGEFTNTSRGQDLNTNLGKLLRIVPSRAPGVGDYMPAADNPFASDPKPKSAIYAYGLRSPWRGVLDAKGRYIVGDVGDQRNEEVNVVTAKGQNFGWGLSADTSGPCSGNCVSPLIYWRNDSHDPYRGTGDLTQQASRSRVVWIGAQYGDCGNDRYGGAMTGVTTFGDLYTGWVRGLVVGDDGKAATDVSLLERATSIIGITSMEQGPDGYLYATTFGTYGAELEGVRPELHRVLPQ
jgi:hypothetical protein